MTEASRTRCSPSSTCTENSTCIIYTSPNPLLRIGVDKDGALETILWSGPPLEIWEQGECFPSRLHTSVHDRCSRSGRASSTRIHVSVVAAKVARKLHVVRQVRIPIR